MFNKRFIIALLGVASSVAVCGFVRSDDDPLAKIRQQLNKWAYGQLVEKVYLQLDKPYYAAGDDIWFKAYVVSGSLHQPSNISAIVNVELIDDRNSITRSVKLPLKLGVANGDFALPDTLHQGIYHIRAYTNYMRNAGSDYFFNQSISIINTVQPGKLSLNQVVNNRSLTNKIDIQFFPESGYLVNGINTKIAFKAIGQNGLGTDIKGIVTDDKGHQVTQFGSTHLGMGVFSLTPVTGVVYKATIITGDGVKTIVSLPQVQSQGFVLNILDDTNQNLIVNVSSNGFTNTVSRQVTWIAQSGGKIYSSVKNANGYEVLSSIVPKNKFPSGIVQFTLFSPTGEPLNKRLVFIQNPDQLNLTLATDKSVYAPRDKVGITLNAQSGHLPAAGNFSVSVTDETKVPVDEKAENNIMSNLLLTSDLKGYIEQPAYYFNKPNDQTRADLDMLMLTQGYRRFEWKQLLQDALPTKKYLPENSLQVAGTILTTGGKPVANATVKLFDLDSVKFTRDTVTDDLGRFVFKNLTFDDSIRFIVQARTSKNKRDVDIKMDQLEPPLITSNKYLPGLESSTQNNLSVYAQSSKQFFLEQRKYGLGNHVFTLQEVVIREKRELARNSSNLNGPGNADQVVPGRIFQEQDCVHIADCLQGRLLGVTFRNGIPYSTRDFRPMQLIVDGVYVESSYLNTINYNDIQAIEILRNSNYTSIYGGRGASGVFLVTTKRGGEDDDYPEPRYGRGITTYYPKGYYKVREFYSPRYVNPKINKPLADLRTTIYWNPNLTTGQDGKTTFDYFNAGSKGIYRVVVEGIDSDGKIGRVVYRYKVQ